MNKYKNQILSNKLTLLTVPVKDAKTATILIMFKTGSKYETRRNNGLSHFLEHMFFKGTERRPNTLALSSELDALGGTYNAFTTKEHTGYWVKVAANKLLPALDILEDMLINSKFAEAEIEREKGVIIEELNMYEENPLMHVEDIFEACLYGDTPAGWETIGTKANIRRFKRQDFMDYFTTQYGSRSAYVILAGGIRQQDEKAVKRILLNFRSNRWQDKAPVTEKQTSPRLRAVIRKNDQVNLSLGVRAYPSGHPEEYRLKLLSIILGGAMSSRLFIRLRERNGLAYYVHTTSDFYSDTGYLTTQAGVPADKLEPAIKIILEEYARLATELVSRVELKRAKDMLQGRLLLQMESSDNLANWYGRQAAMRRTIISPAAFMKIIKGITAEELRLTARQVFTNERLNLALIGRVNEKKIKKILKFPS